MRQEDAIQQGIVAFLERALPSDSYFFAIPNGAVLAGDEVARAKQARKLKATGTRPGAPDVWILCRGQSIALEVKSPSGRLSPVQKEASDQIFRASGLYSVVRSAEEAERYLRSCGLHLRATLLPVDHPISRSNPFRETT